MDEKIKTVAIILAAAYWRGRLYPLSSDLSSTGVTEYAVEAMIKTAAERDWPRWQEAAKAAIAMSNQV